MKSPLYTQYTKEVAPKIAKDLGVKNVMNVPHIEKVCVNVGMGSYLHKLGSKDFSYVTDNVQAISGRKPVTQNAKLSVSNFKLREGQPVGVSVTLRKDAAYDFLYKLINVVYPRVRDFRGVNKNVFDKNGNMSVGFKDCTVFPEVQVPEDTRKIHGVQVTVVTSAKDADGARMLMTELGFPFKK